MTKQDVKLGDHTYGTKKQGNLLDNPLINQPCMSRLWRTKIVANFFVMYIIEGKTQRHSFETIIVGYINKMGTKKNQQNLKICLLTCCLGLEQLICTIELPVNLTCSFQYVGL